jgi:pimeloyl-ACP methyl ester carboxylesterase
VSALALIAGPYASPLHTFYGSRLGVHVFPFVYHGLPLVPRPLQFALGHATRLPIAMPVARSDPRARAAHPRRRHGPLLPHLAKLDPLVLIKIVRGMHEFDAGPWLSEIDVPVLIFVAGRDTFCPPEVGEAILASVPEGELATIPEGTHGVPIEFPLEIADRIHDFLHRRLGRPEVPAVGRSGHITPPREVSRPVRPA